MKKIGHEVLFLATGPDNPRNGEGTFARLSDGRILFAYTDFYGDSWDDHATANISGCYSSDEGETWSEPISLLKKDPAAANIMSPSLFPLSDGGLGMVYLRDEVVNGMMSCMPLFRRSDDFGATWSSPVSCVEEDRYYCAVNDCACIHNGRVYIPMSCHDHYIKDGKPHEDYVRRRHDVLIVYTEDDGKTWNPLCRYTDPFEQSIGLAEPGVYFRENGDLWSWYRTTAGYQYQTYSADGGKTMAPSYPNFCFTSPDAPMHVKKCGDYLIAVYNPQSFGYANTATEAWPSAKRTPLVCAVSTDDGESFALDGKSATGGAYQNFIENCYLLEDDITNSYCYPAILPVKDGFLVHYYHSNGTNACLSSGKITKVYYNELT